MDASADFTETESKDEAEEPAAKRPKTEAKEDEAEEAEDPEDINAQLAELFGDDLEESGLAKVLAEAEAALSDAESVPSFQVEEPKDRDEEEEAADFGISQEKLDLVKDIFGDASVLRPIVEVDVPDEEAAPPAVHASLGAAEAAVAAAKREADDEEKPATGAPPVLPVLTDSLDPDILEKSYQLPKDQAYTSSQEPERWLQAYCQGLQPSEQRSWTDEEYQNEARWIFIQVFKAKGYTRSETEDAILHVLTLLHEKRLEMLYIVEHLWWKVSKVFSKPDLWSIQEYDLLWQPLWARYLYLQKWVDNVEQASLNNQLPDYIKNRVVREVWMHSDAEAYQKDVQEWLYAMHPHEAPTQGRQHGRSRTSVDAIMSMARQSRFDEKLGIVPSIEIMTLQNFGITPAQLGDNLQIDRQAHYPEEDKDNETTHEDVCDQHIDANFHNVQAVKDGVATFLVRLIASEPRVRHFVRKEFWKLCSVSAKVTQAGKAVAKEASHSFKQIYRAFHVTYRPVSKFDEKSDLFLEMLQLQRKGLVTLEYTLVQNFETDEDEQMKVVLPCQGRAGMGRTKQRFEQHFKARDPQRAPHDPDELLRWNESEALIPKLEAAAKLREVVFRRRSAMNDLKTQVTSSFQCAAIRLDGETLADFMTHDPIFEKLCLMYCVTTIENAAEEKYGILETNWNSVRRSILERVLRDELYPLIWAEVQDELSRTSSEVVCRNIHDRLTKMLDVRPSLDTKEKLDEAEENLNQRRQDSDDESATRRRLQDPDWLRERLARIRGLHSALVILPEVGLETCVIGFVNAFGEPLDMRQVFKSCLRSRIAEGNYEKGSFGYDKIMKIKEHRAEVKKLIATYKPSVILVAVTDSDVLRLKVNIEDLINQEQDVLAHLKVLPKIKFVNSTVPRAIAYHKRVMASPAYRDFPTPAHRIAISCARFFQDPLAETCQLWHELPEENGLFKIDLHHLQHDVPKELLGRTITQVLQETFAKCGLYINKVRRAPHMHSLIQFVPGLGPRKARLFLKTLTDSVKSRDTVVDVMAKQLGLREDPTANAVMRNMHPFIKIQPDIRDPWLSDESPSLDRLRLPPELQHWVKALCREALGTQSQDLFNDAEDAAEGDVVARVIRLLKEDENFVNVFQDKDWSRWPEEAGELNIADGVDLDKLFDTILNELQDPYKDLRQVEEQELQASDLFYLALTEKAEEFRAGCVVRATVLKDEEYPDMEAGRNEADSSKLHRVHVKLAGGYSVNGTFQKEYRQTTQSKKSGHIAGCNRHFVLNEPVLARVREIKAGRTNFSLQLSVDHDEENWFELYPIQADDIPYFLPDQHDDWTKVSLGLLDNTELQRKAKLKDWVRRPRNIKHPNYVPGDHMHAVQALDHFFIGTVLFRSSKHHDMLIAMLKVLPTQEQEVASGGMVLATAERCYRSFDVFEKRRTRSYGEGFEVAQELEVDGYLYRDFDEIISRHMDPIMDNLRILQEHKRFGLRNGTLIERDKVEHAMRKISVDNSVLHYSLLLHDREYGHGALHWCVQGKRVKQELIEITPRGFGLWNNHFDNLETLIAWFKKIGWRNSHKLRQQYKDLRKSRAQEMREKRGDHADPEARLKRHKGLGVAVTTTTGLQTPGGQSVAGNFRPESNVGTPLGMRSPGGASNPGSVAPGSTGSAAPGSHSYSAPGSVAPGSVGTHGPLSPAPPTPMAAFTAPGRGVPITPANPGTPANFFSPAGSAYRAPVSPGLSPGLAIPETPLRGTPRDSAIPQTPLGAFHTGTAAGTPGGLVPQTPIGAFSRGTPSGHIPQTPAAAFPRGVPPGTPGNAIPQTPTDAFTKKAGVKEDEG